LSPVAPENPPWGESNHGWFNGVLMELNQEKWDFIVISWVFILIQWDINGIYPLVNIQKAMENGPFVYNELSH